LLGAWRNGVGAHGQQPNTKEVRRCRSFSCRYL